MSNWFKKQMQKYSHLVLIGLGYDNLLLILLKESYLSRLITLKLSGLLVIMLWKIFGSFLVHYYELNFTMDERI